jgi:hypothetical protein
MRNIPVATDQLQTIAIEVVPKERDGTQSTADGVPIWNVRTLVALGDGSKPEVIDVSVTAARQPEVVALTPVQLVGLRMSPWSMGDRSGVSFRADDVLPLNGAKVRQPAEAAS